MPKLSLSRSTAAPSPQPSRRERRAAARKQARELRRRGALAGTLSAGAALAAALGLSPSPAHAAPIEVTNTDDSGAGSLREALATANNTPGLDTITFQTGLTGEIKLTSGQLEITDSVDIQGPGADVLSVSGGDTSRVFYLYASGSTIDVVISNLMVTHGSASEGAGIVDYDENLTLDHVQIADNASTGDGAGLWADGFSMTLEIHDSVLSGNASGDDGGGIYIEDTGGDMVIDSTQVTGNTAADKGGGIYFYDPDHDITISKSTISGNTAGDIGGGVYLYSFDNGGMTISETTISGNTANAGGGLFLYGIDTTPLVIESSTISGNQALTGDGGGIYLYNDSAGSTIINSTISGNQALAGDGGGIYLYNGSTGVTIANSTIAANSAMGNGGGLAINSGTVTVTNSLIADNTATTDNDLHGAADLAYSLVEDEGTATITDSGGNITAMDPLLGPLVDNGGPTMTHLPGAGSPALDHGDPAFAAPPASDQRGKDRVYNTVIDMGAVERNPGTVQLKASSASVGENAGKVTLTAERTGGSDGDVEVSYASADGTAKSSTDYTAASGQLSWTNQSSADKTFDVNVTDDNLVESDEGFSATLSSPTNGAVLGATTSATVTVTDDDSAPTISAIDDQAVDEDTATGALDFTVGDTDDGAAAVTVSASSSNQDLVADANIVVSGSGASRSVVVTPGAEKSGDTTITLTVSDGTNEAVETFTLTVSAVDDAPVFAAAIADQTIDEDGSTDVLDFMVDDVDTNADDLVVTATSSDEDILPDTGIELGGSGSDRTIQLTPAADANGDVTVTLTVSDGNSEASTTFTLTVNAVEDEPTGGDVTTTTPDAGTGSMKPDSGSMMEPASKPDAGTSMSGTGVGSVGKDDEPSSDDDEVTGTGSSDEASDDMDGNGKGQTKAGGGGCSAVDSGSTSAGTFAPILLGLAAIGSRRRKRSSKR